MNSINLLGRLTSDVELKQTTTGKAVCSFTLAVDRPNTKDKTDFINCVAWERTAEFIARYFRKGNRIAVTGILTSRQFQDQQGKNRVAFEVLIDRAEFCESKQDNAPEYAKPTKEPNYEAISPEDDLPF